MVTTPKGNIPSPPRKAPLPSRDEKIAMFAEMASLLKDRRHALERIGQAQEDQVTWESELEKLDKRIGMLQTRLDTLFEAIREGKTYL